LGISGLRGLRSPARPIKPILNGKRAYRQNRNGLLRFDCLGIVVTLGIAMLFIHGDIVMRILSKRQLKELVLYSPQHVARLEKAGQFPKRVQLGPNRVGWVEDEVLDWLQKRLDGREIPYRHS
jgi:prophage regulatory protein